MFAAGPWSRLLDGPMLAGADERARSASEYRPETIPPVVDDPTSATVLSVLGYRLEATSYPSWATGPRRSHTWKRHYAANAFILQLPARLASEIASEGLEDGTVRQCLRTEDAVATVEDDARSVANHDAVSPDGPVQLSLFGDVVSVPASRPAAAAVPSSRGLSAAA